MTTPCAHQFSRLTKHPTRGNEVASGVCSHCKTRLCVHDLLDPRKVAAAITYRFTHPLSSAAVSACPVCQGSPQANTFEARRLHPWFDGEGPALPAGWSFAGNAAGKEPEAK